MSKSVNASDLRPASEVNPSSATVEALRSRPDDNAIIMLNLLRYREPDGAEAYARYGKVAGGTVRARGGFAPYTAAVVDEHAEWDRATLVRYPRRAAYLDMQSDPAYIGAIPDRTAGLEARVLYAFHDPHADPDQDFEIAQSTPEEAFVVSVVRFAAGMSSTDWTPQPNVVMDLEADQAMVSDGLWDRLMVTRYESIALARTHRNDDAIVESIDLVTQPAGWSFPIPGETRQG